MVGIIADEEDVYGISVITRYVEACIEWGIVSSINLGRRSYFGSDQVCG
jgi:hypothetical protein